MRLQLTRSRVVLVAAGALVALQIADIVSTKIVLDMGAVEANLINFLLQYFHPTAWWVPKIVLGVITATYLLTQPKLSRVMIGFLAFYLLVVCNNIVVMIYS